MSILDLPMARGNDAGAKTIKDYFKALLKQVLTEEESFSGKRPFGNSGWMHDLYLPMVKAGIIAGEMDSDGYLEDYDRDEALKKLLAAVKEL